MFLSGILGFWVAERRNLSDPALDAPRLQRQRSRWVRWSDLGHGVVISNSARIRPKTRHLWRNRLPIEL